MPDRSGSVRINLQGRPQMALCLFRLTLPEQELPKNGPQAD